MGARTYRDWSLLMSNDLEGQKQEPKPMPGIKFYFPDAMDTEAMVKRYKEQADEANTDALTEMFTMLIDEQRQNLIMRGQCQGYQQALAIFARGGRKR